MAGLGLSDALVRYQQGVNFRQQQDLQERETRRRDAVNAASKAGADILTQAQRDHEAQQAAALMDWTKQKGSAEGFKATPFRADENLYIRAMDARSAALASRGEWDDWLKAESIAMPLRERVRENTIGKALQQYDSDGDPVALAKAVYPTVYDGKEIADVQVDKTGGLGFKGAAGLSVAGKDLPSERYVFKLSDGTTLKPMTKDQLVERVKWAQMNPAEVRKYEFAQRAEAAKRAAELEQTKAKESMRGDQDRQTEGVKHGHKMAQIGLLNAGRQEVAETRADTSLKVAATRAAGGGKGGAGGTLQSTKVDENGHMVGIYRDGSVRQLMIDGKPVKAETWSKRVDALAARLSKSLDGFDKSPEELRKAAIDVLGDETDSKPPAAEKSAKDYSSMWK